MLLTDGFPLTLQMNQGSIPAVVGQFRVKRMQPSGHDGGGRVDATSMQSLRARIGNPKALLSPEQIKVTAYYDPIMLSTFPNFAQRNGLITVTFPDASSVDFYGWFEKFTPPEHQEGEDALCEIIIEVSNHNGVTSVLNGSLMTTVGTETLPVYHAPTQQRGQF